MSQHLKRNGKSESFLDSGILIYTDPAGRSADLGTAIQSYVTNMTATVEGLHKGVIDNVYGPTYLNMSVGGAMLGNFKTDEPGYSSKIIEQVSALFYMKAIE